MATPTPEISPRAVGAVEFVLLPRRANGSVIVDPTTVARAPRVRSAATATSVTGATPGTIIAGEDGTLGVAGSGGTPVAMASEVLSGALADLDTTDKSSLVAGINEVRDMVLALDPDASTNIEANEVVLELADGSKKQIQAASDTVEAALVDIDAAFGAAVSTLTTTTKTLVGGINEINADAVRDGDIGVTVQAYSAVLAMLAANARDALVKATVACPSPAGGVNDAALSVQLKDLSGTNIATARQFLLQAAGIQYADSSGPGNASLSLVATTGTIVATPNAGGLWLVQTDAAGLFAGTLTNTDDEAVAGVSAKTATGGVSVVGEACVVVGSNAVAVTWSP